MIIYSVINREYLQMETGLHFKIESQLKSFCMSSVFGSNIQIPSTLMNAKPHLFTIF